MMHLDTYAVSESALNDAAIRGIAGQIANRLSRMAKRSAPFTCRLGNRRYDDYILSISQEGVIEQVRLMNELN